MDKLVEKNNKGAHNLVYPFDTLPQPGRMLKIDNGVYWVRMSLPFALNHINLWVLKDDNGWVVVDTGVASADIKSNWRKCFFGDMNGESVNKIIVTHLHPDHIGLAGWMNKKFSAPLYMSRSDYLMCRMLVSDTGREAPEEGKSLYRSAGFTEDELDTYSERFGGFGSAITKLPDSYNRLKDYDVINIGTNAPTATNNVRPNFVNMGNHEIYSSEANHLPNLIYLGGGDDRVQFSGGAVEFRCKSSVTVNTTRAILNFEN